MTLGKIKGSETRKKSEISNPDSIMATKSTFFILLDYVMRKADQTLNFSKVFD